MKTYDIRFLTKQGDAGDYELIANDARHAIVQMHELRPEVRVISVQPQSMWSES